MSLSNITVSTEVDDETAQAIELGLNSYNEAHAGAAPTTPLWIVSRDDEGNVTGGLQAIVQWDWLAIAMLWVREDQRGRGIGSKLLLEAEAAARDRGCTRARLATTTFQAPAFYERFGYVEISRMPDVPPGHAFISMVKNLRA